MILGWTWRTMLAGEEQFVVGLLEHDGLPNVNFDTYVQVAGEFKKLEQYAFPYNPVPEIGVAHSYDADWVIQYPNNIQFKQDYRTCMRESNLWPLLSCLLCVCVCVCIHKFDLFIHLMLSVCIFSGLTLWVWTTS